MEVGKLVLGLAAVSRGRCQRQWRSKATDQVGDLRLSRWSDGEGSHMPYGGRYTPQETIHAIAQTLLSGAYRRYLSPLNFFPSRIASCSPLNR